MWNTSLYVHHFIYFYGYIWEALYLFWVPMAKNRHALIYSFHHVLLHPARDDVPDQIGERWCFEEAALRITQVSNSAINKIVEIHCNLECSVPGQQGVEPTQLLQILRVACPLTSKQGQASPMCLMPCRWLLQLCAILLMTTTALMDGRLSAIKLRESFMAPFPVLVSEPPGGQRGADVRLHLLAIRGGCLSNCVFY